jgi:ABC-type dipeptide/oligopeptide/nickel transport system permease component
MAQGDLGKSLGSGRQISGLIGERLWNTVRLASIAGIIFPDFSLYMQQSSVKQESSAVVSFLLLKVSYLWLVSLKGPNTILNKMDYFIQILF